MKQLITYRFKDARRAEWRLTVRSLESGEGSDYDWTWRYELFDVDEERLAMSGLIEGQYDEPPSVNDLCLQLGQDFNTILIAMAQYAIQTDN